MGIYNLNHFHNRDEAVKYYAKGAKEFSEEGAKHFERDEILQGECAFAKAKIFIDNLVDALDYEFE